MALYDRQIETAKRMISKYGQSVTWRKRTEILEDDDKPWEPSEGDEGSPVDATVSICFLPMDLQNKKLIQYMTGKEVATGFLVGLMGEVSFSVDIKDTVVRGSEVLKIASIDTLAPNGRPILHTVEFQE